MLIITNLFMIEQSEAIPVSYRVIILDHEEKEKSRRNIVPTLQLQFENELQAKQQQPIHCELDIPIAIRKSEFSIGPIRFSKLKDHPGWNLKQVLLCSNCTKYFQKM